MRNLSQKVNRKSFQRRKKMSEQNCADSEKNSNTEGTEIYFQKKSPNDKRWWEMCSGKAYDNWYQWKKQILNNKTSLRDCITMQKKNHFFVFVFCCCCCLQRNYKNKMDRTTMMTTTTTKKKMQMEMEKQQSELLQCSMLNDGLNDCWSIHQPKHMSVIYKNHIILYRIVHWHHLTPITNCNKYFLTVIVL